MDELLIQRFARHARQQSEFVVVSSNAVRAASIRVQMAVMLPLRAFPNPMPGHRLSDLEEKLGSTEADRDLWFSAHGCVNAAANVARLLWSADAQVSARREPVRRALGVADEEGDVWKAARQIRNKFVHYDEKLEEAAGTGETVHVGAVFGEPLKILGHSERAEFRGYDPATHTVRFWGVPVALDDLAVEAFRLMVACDELMKQA